MICLGDRVTNDSIGWGKGLTEEGYGLEETMQINYKMSSRFIGTFSFERLLYFAYNFG